MARGIVGCHTHPTVRYVATPYQKNTIPYLLLTRMTPPLPFHSVLHTFAGIIRELKIWLKYSRLSQYNYKKLSYRLLVVLNRTCAFEQLLSKKSLI